jgi:hypothetical protein
MSSRPSPSRSQKRTLRPAPNFGVSNFFHRTGFELAARRAASSLSRASMRARTAAAAASLAVTAKP